MGLVSRLCALAFTLTAAFSHAAQAQSLIRDAEIEELIREWADPLLLAAELNPESVEIYLVGDSSLNAFVTAGQRMFFNAGIITAADKPNELIGVIAHETGHIEGAHLVRQAEGQRSALVPAIATIAAGILAAAAGEGGAAAGLLASSQQFAALEYFSFTRGIESSADQAALRYLEATGQSGRGLITFFDRFRDQEVFSQLSIQRAQNLDPYFRTHPLSSQRIEALQALVDRQVYADAVDDPEDVRRLRLVQAKLHGFFDRPSTTLSRFPEENQSDPALYARAVAYHKLGKLDQAVAEMTALIERQPNNPYFHELLGQIYAENGRPQLAVDPYARAVALKPGAALIRVGLAAAILDSGGEDATAGAMEHLVFALAAEPDNGFAWYQRSRVHEARGEQALAEYATAELRLASGDVRQAFIFAQRASRSLDRGTPEWLRSMDIINLARQELDRLPDARQRPRNRG